MLHPVGGMRESYGKEGAGEDRTVHSILYKKGVRKNHGKKECHRMAFHMIMQSQVNVMHVARLQRSIS